MPDWLTAWLSHQGGGLLIAAVVPLLVAFYRAKVHPGIPKWAIPILAGALGPAIDQLLAFTTAYQGNATMAALLGVAGVGIREIYDQTIGADAKAAKAQPPDFIGR
jgi:hypothetical protein